MLLNPPNRQPGSINRGGLRNARRGVPADPLADLYGTGMGQMPMLLDPLDAAMSGANVVSVPNRGGAGPAFNATVAAGTMTRTGGLLNVPTAAVRLDLATPADLRGVRTFMVVALDAGADPFSRLLGHLSPANLIRVNSSTGQLLLQRAGVTLFLTAPATPPGTALRLWEVEIANGRAKSWMDGVLAGDGPCTFTDFQASMIFAAFDSNGFTGQAGIVGSVITDGSVALDPVMLRVRQTLAARYGIALP